MVVVESYGHSDATRRPPVVAILPNVVQVRWEEPDPFLYHVVYIAHQLVVTVLLWDVPDVEVDFQLRLRVSFSFSVLLFSASSVIELDPFLDAFKLVPCVSVTYCCFYSASSSSKACMSSWL